MDLRVERVRIQWRVFRFLTRRRAPGPVLLRRDADGVGPVTLNRPGARNALSRPLIDALQDELDAVGDERSVKDVVLAGHGPGLCAGYERKAECDQPRR